MLFPVVAGKIREFPQLFWPTQKPFQGELLFRVVLGSHKKKVRFYQFESRTGVAYLINVSTGRGHKVFPVFVAVVKKVPASGKFHIKCHV